MGKSEAKRDELLLKLLRTPPQPRPKRERAGKDDPRRLASESEAHLANKKRVHKGAANG